MEIFIHSAGRAHLPLPTLEALLKTKQASSVRLVVQKAEARAYQEAWPSVPTIVLPPRIVTLSPTRQWLIENATEAAIVLMDDDLSFYERRKDDRTKFLPASPASLNKMLATIDMSLYKFAHVGVLGREGGNRVLERTIQCSRMMRVLAYHVPTLKEVGARFDRVPTKQDFDMTLQLLRKGYANLILCDWVQNQKGSGTAGGCSVYRDDKMMDTSAHKLAQLHPGLVKVVDKETKSAWGGGIRKDVHISWKKAYEEG